MVEIQKGLFLEIRSYFAKGKLFEHAILTAGDGYHFYDVNEQVFDDYGNVIQTEKAYMTKTIEDVVSVEEFNRRFISVPI